MIGALPYGSGHFLPTRRSLSVGIVFDNDRCTRVGWSAIRCASLLGRFRGPLLLELFKKDAPLTPFAI